MIFSLALGLTVADQVYRLELVRLTYHQDRRISMVVPAPPAPPAAPAAQDSAFIRLPWVDGAVVVLLLHRCKHLEACSIRLLPPVGSHLVKVSHQDRRVLDRGATIRSHSLPDQEARLVLLAQTTGKDHLKIHDRRLLEQLATRSLAHLDNRAMRLPNPNQLDNLCSSRHLPQEDHHHLLTRSRQLRR
jgi:hypothetical protein